MFLHRAELCDKCVSIFGGNVRAYYTNFKKLSKLGVMIRDKDGYYCVSEKYDLKKYENVEVIAFKLNN